MICGTCAQENQPNAKFCVECGAPLARSCPACDSQLPPTAKFCGECGTALTPGLAAPPASVAPVSAVVRKQVTALFADLAGSTAFAERVDPEAARASLAPYFEILRSAIEDHGGTVAKFLGDGVLALFGVPEVAEDDALRAVAAGVDLQYRFRSFADAIRERHGVEVGLRIGVNSGELVVGDDDEEMVGDVLNTASRLEAACTPGQVLVGEETWRLTRSVVAYEVLGEVRVKGKSDAIATFQVLDRGGVRDELTPFVGRAAELAALRGLFAEVETGSRARLATVLGAPGVGKTRLAQELRAECGARAFDLRLERRGSTTFTPIADLLREVTGSGSVEEIAGLVEGLPDAERLGLVLASLLGHGEPRTTEESFWAVRRLLELLAAAGPVIVVVDDIQWAEPLFWDLLEHLVEWTAGPVLLVALARPELRELRPDLTQPGRRVSVALALEGLDAATTRQLAARMLGSDELPAELADRLPESTEGNPLFVRELVQMLVGDGVLVRDGDRWRLTIDAGAIEVPPTILSLLASRVERLADDERQVVELASVVGTEFDRGTIEAIAAEDVVARLGGLIDRLRRKDVIEPTGAWSGDHPVYRFHHVLIRDAAYRRLLKATRAELHERVGRHLDATAVPDDELAVIVAHHFEQVHRYRSELGTVDAATRSLAAVASARLQSAAELALSREDLTSAGRCVLRALPLIGDDAGGQRDELLLIGCEALLSSGDVASGAPLVDELAHRSSDARLGAWAECFRAQLWSLTDTDRLTDAGEIAAAAADRLAALGDDPGVAKARLVRASCLARLGRVGDCETELDLALSAARAAGDRRRTVAVLGAAPLAVLWGPSTVARAGGRCLDVLRLLRITTASPAVEATSIRCQGVLEALRGRFDSARSKLEASRRTARDLGLRQGLCETDLFAGFVELLAGDPVAAEPHLRAAQGGLGRLGIGADAGYAGALLARSLLLQGRIDEADELASHALDTAGQNLQTAIASRAVLAEVRAQQGRHDDAHLLIAEAIATAEGTDATLDRALTLLAAARVATAAGDETTARGWLAKASHLLHTKGAVLAPTGAGAAESGGEAVTSAVSNAGGEALRNRVVATVERAVARLLAGDRRAYTACFATHVISLDHGDPAVAVEFGGRVGAKSWVDFAFWMVEQVEDPAIGIDPLALRGETHALVRFVLSAPNAAMERLLVVTDDDGLVAGMDWYDATQLGEALDELDRRYRQSCGIADDHWITTNWKALTSFDADVYAGFLATDFQSVDHRPGSLGVVGREEFLAWLRATPPTASWSVPVIHRLSNRALVGEHLERWTDGAGATRMLFLAEHGDRAVVRMECYEPEDLDAALARYDEITGARRRALTNLAWEAAGRGREHAGAELELLAIRGEDFCLYRLDQTGRLVICEAGDRPSSGSRSFGPDELADAFAELDRRYRLACGIGDDHWMAESWHMLYAADFAEYEAVLHPEFEYVERRRIAWPDGDANDLARYSTTYAIAPTVTIPAIHRLGEHGLVYTRAEAMGDVVDENILLLELEDERTRRIVAYEPDHLDRALADFDAFVARRTSSRPLTNPAWEAVQAAEAMRRAGDREGYAVTLAEDLVVVTHDPIMASLDDGRYDKDLFLGMLFDPNLSFGPTSTTESELIAVRDDDFCLHHWRLTTIDGDVHERLMMVECSDGRAVRIDSFPPDQLRAAQLMLDRRWLTTKGFDEGDWLVRHWDLVYNKSFAVVAGVLHRDFEAFDHRRLHYPSGDATTLQTNMGTLSYEVEVVVPRIHRICRAAMVVELTERAAGDVLAEHPMITVVEIADEALRRMDFYEIDDLPSALARYEELTATRPPPVAPLTNRAWELASALPRAGGPNEHLDVVAVRGEHFCLVLVDDRNDHDRPCYYMVVETDSERVCEQVRFDHHRLIDAQLELDRRWLASVGYADHWFEPIRLLMYDPHPHAMFEHFAPDFQYIDHRPLMFPSGDADQLRVNIDSLQHEMVCTVPRIHRLTDHGSVLERIETAVGEVGQHHIVFVSRFADRLVQSMEAFDITQLSEALARYDEFTTGSSEFPR